MDIVIDFVNVVIGNEDTIDVIGTVDTAAPYVPWVPHAA
mgnify:CR=1 FL=1